MTRGVQGASVSDLQRRMTRVADLLRGALPRVLEAGGGSSVHPARLVRAFSLDKSLASRLVRSLRSESSLQLIHLIPSPIGLRMVLDAAESKGVERRHIEKARGAVDQFENLLQDVPGGKSSLDALLSTSVPEVKERAERNAQQTVYRAMKQLLGIHCEANTTAVILQPSADRRFADAIDLHHRAGIRHLRPDVPAALHSATYGTEDPNGGPSMVTLAGAPIERTAESFLLPEFCTQPLPPLRVYHEGPVSILALDETRLLLHSPVTITTGFIVRKGFLTHARPGAWEEWRSYLLACPCKLLVRDLFIRDDLYAGSLPEVRLEFPLPPGARRVHSRTLPRHMTQLDISAPVEQLGFGLANSGIVRVPAHRRMLAHAFEQAGWDPGRFRGYRCRIEYPLPMIAMGWWISLPEEPRPAPSAGRAETDEPSSGGMEK